MSLYERWDGHVCGGKTSSGSPVMGKIPLQNNTHEHLKTLGLFSAVSSNMCNSLSSGTLQKKKIKSFQIYSR